MTISASEFDYICRFVRDHAAIQLTEGKEYLVEARLAPVLRREGMRNISQLIERLRGRAGDPVQVQVVEALTTNETLFFRDAHPFEALRSRILPELAKARRTELRIWSAACSTGQEPYSLAMLLLDEFPSIAPRCRIHATDINCTVLARARQASFSALEIQRGLPTDHLSRHFVATADGHHQLREAPRRMVDFAQLNLAGAWSHVAPMDLVLLRNVLIYFDDATKRTILARVRASLASGGWLILGGAESTLSLDDQFERVIVGRSVVYRAP